MIELENGCSVMKLMMVSYWCFNEKNIYWGWNMDDDDDWGVWLNEGMLMMLIIE